MVNLDGVFRRRSMKACIVMTIHDSLWLDCPHEEASEVSRLLRRMMITTARLAVPLEVVLTELPDGTAIRPFLAEVIPSSANVIEKE